MRQLFGVTAMATIIAIMLIQIQSSTACMCMPTHSQSSYCNSDYGKFHSTDAGVKLVILNVTKRTSTETKSQIDGVLISIQALFIKRSLSQNPIMKLCLQPAAFKWFFVSFVRSFSLNVVMRPPNGWLFASGAIGFFLCRNFKTLFTSRNNNVNLLFS